VGPTALNTPCREFHGFRDRQGYGRLRRNGFTWFLHRWVVAQIDGEDAIEDKIVMHRCDNPPCFRHDHLVIGTRSDNNADRTTKGRTARGTTKYLAKLDADKVLDIRRRLEAGESQQSLAIRFGVNCSSISKVIHRRTWAWVVESDSST
jgi:hypothetical protein